MTDLCSKLDLYLLGDLAPAEHAAFARHLGECPACRAQAQLQRRVDVLLADASRTAEELPSGLVDRVERRLRARRRQRLLVAGMAAALVAAAGLLQWRIAGLVGAGKPPIAKGAPAAPNIAASPPPPGPDAAAAKVSIESAAIGVRMPTHNPRVTLVWVYPTIRPQGDPSVTQ